MKRFSIILAALLVLTLGSTAMAIGGSAGSKSVRRSAPATRTIASLTSAIRLAPAAKPTVPVPPVITSLSTYNGVPGTVVTINGTGFGDQKRDSIVWFNGKSAHFNSWTNTQIVFVVPDGVPSGYVGIENDAGCSNGFYFVPFDKPLVSSVSAATGAVGSSITITGSNFGTAQGTGYVSFEGVRGSVTSWTDTQIVVTVPSGAPAGYVGVVQYELSSNGTLFTPYFQPAVASVSHKYALVGDQVTITGTDFGAEAQQVVVDGMRIAPDSWSDTQVTFTVPTGVRSGYCGVLRGDVVSNGIYLWVAPKVDSTSNWWAAPGTQVTVSGHGFGPQEGEAFNLLFGGTRISADSWSDTAVTFTVPMGASSAYVGFTDSQGVSTSNGVWLLIIDEATITGVSATDVAVGGTFTVQGTVFGTAGSGELRHNGVTLEILSWSDTEIVAVAPATPAYGYLSVSKSGVDSNGWLLNVYEPATASVPETPSAGL